MTTENTSFWWLKRGKQSAIQGDDSGLEPPLTNKENDVSDDVDVGSILDEINRVAAQSPLGPFEKRLGEKSVEELISEAEQIYLESSKSFELSPSSKLGSPTLKSPSPIHSEINTRENSESEEEEYSDDFLPPSGNLSIFSNNDKSKTVPSNIKETKDVLLEQQIVLDEDKNLKKADNLKHTEFSKSVEHFSHSKEIEDVVLSTLEDRQEVQLKEILIKHEEESKIHQRQILLKDDIIKMLQNKNDILNNEKTVFQGELEVLRQQVCLLKTKQNSQNNFQLEKITDQLKDANERTTALQLQHDDLNLKYVELKTTCEALRFSNETLERQVIELNSNLSQKKNELINIQLRTDKLQENEYSLNKLLDIEKMKTKTLKMQSERDGKCIQDLNRQVKEMERIISRKHPDSVSALIVAAKNDANELSLSARKVLENRVKSLESEAKTKDEKTSKVILDIQEKFNQVKLKYEHHIEDLELHVNDLKSQLKKKNETYDIYTQTLNDNVNIPQKDSVNCSTQTDPHVVKPQIQREKVAPKKWDKGIDIKSEAHLMASLRGLQSELSTKDKAMSKLQRELDDLQKINKRLHKEQEEILKNLREKRGFPDKPNNKSQQNDYVNSENKENSKEHNCSKIAKLESEYQALKTKRLQDLNALQEAHEREILDKQTQLSFLKQQTELQKVSISTLQTQLSAIKNELVIVSVERDHLNNRLLNINSPAHVGDNYANEDSESLHKKISQLQQRYEDREQRLRAIVNGLAQKNITNRSCDQCFERQQQLISYKVELDQLLATLQSLK